jgi:hypothetical protein
MENKDPTKPSQTDWCTGLNRPLSVVEGIALGEQALRVGQVHSQAAAKRRFAKWLK